MFFRNGSRWSSFPLPSRFRSQTRKKNATGQHSSAIIIIFIIISAHLTTYSCTSLQWSLSSLSRWHAGYDPFGCQHYDGDNYAGSILTRSLHWQLLPRMHHRRWCMWRQQRIVYTQVSRLWLSSMCRKCRFWFCERMQPRCGLPLRVSMQSFFYYYHPDMLLAFLLFYLLTEWLTDTSFHVSPCSEVCVYSSNNDAGL